MVQYLLKLLHIDAFKLLQCGINTEVTNNLETINVIYLSKCNGKYQNKIPEKCDGIWIKPKFSLIDDCIEISSGSTSSELNELAHFI